MGFYRQKELLDLKGTSTHVGKDALGILSQSRIVDVEI